MKSPAELRLVWRRQWNDPACRESRLLGAPGAWPVILPIGRPTPRMLRDQLDAVKRHIAAWRQVPSGEVVWEEVRYRDADVAVEVPVGWKIERPSQWIEAAGDAAMRHEFDSLARLVEQIDPAFHSLVIRKRGLWRGKPLEEIVQAACLAQSLKPGIAAGRPLRMLPLAGIDTKFWDRHAPLVTAFLDLRFDGEVGRLGLEAFLGAVQDGEHWLLVVDMDGDLLPFQRLRVRASELAQRELPGECLLIVENEACQHQLPNLPGGVAVLGAGFDLSWTAAPWLDRKRVAYWGDLDTWGLQFLARARTAIGDLEALLMTEEIFRQNAQAAVPEPVVAGTVAPEGLEVAEQELYRWLVQQPRGRLEQEFLPESVTRAAILAWGRT